MTICYLSPQVECLPRWPGQAENSVFLQTQRGLSLRGVQTVLSMLTISRHIPPHPCGDPLSDYGLPAGIPQDVPRDDTHHGLLLLDRVRWASMPALFLACC